jgi:hypothetical protein
LVVFGSVAVTSMSIMTGTLPQFELNHAKALSDDSSRERRGSG